MTPERIPPAHKKWLAFPSPRPRMIPLAGNFFSTTDPKSTLSHSLLRNAKHSSAPPRAESRSGRQPANPSRAACPFPSNAPPPGRARVADFRRPQPAEQTKIRFLHGHAPGKKRFSARECRFAGAVRAASPNFGRGHGPNRQPDTPVPCPSERRKILAPRPKFPIGCGSSGPYTGTARRR